MAFGQRICGSIYSQDYLNSLTRQQKIKLDNFNNKLQEKEKSELKEILQQNSLSNPDGFIFIPVVVHVVYNTSIQNISDAQICSQINVLNEDFSRQNSDANNTPSVFASLSSDTRIRFYLATVDPDGNPTSGITRTSTNTASFTKNNNIKHTTTGGHDAWPSNKYLNLWVGNLSNDLLGYAQFPESLSSSPDNDGVVIQVTAFGRGVGFNLNSRFNLGRTATHEIGHWMGLIHIWGDDGVSCSGSDLVSDTPNQAGANQLIPTFPKLDNCTTSSPGVMFMNYMDYTDDAGMNIFSNGQKNRMRANFYSGGFRQNADYAVDVSIQGLHQFCTGSQTYTIPNLPTGTTVSWSVNPSSGIASMSTSGNSLTLTKTGNGNLTINAVVNSSCESINLTREVRIATSNIISVIPYINNCIGGSDWDLGLQAYSDDPNTTQFIWKKDGVIVQNNSSPSYYTYEFPATCITISVSAVNSCGVGPEYITYFCPPCRYSFNASIFPNPSDDEIRIKFQYPITKESLSSQNNIKKFKAVLFDAKGNRRVESENKSIDNLISLDTSKIPNGTYYLHITDGKETIKKQIIIKH